MLSLLTPRCCWHGLVRPLSGVLLSRSGWGCIPMVSRGHAAMPLRVRRSPTVRVVDIAAPPLTAAEAAGISTPGVMPLPAEATFGQLGLSPDLVAALKELNIVQPTEIQRLAVPAVLSGGDYFLASHTGSGKTLAYLLPIVHQLKQQEANGYVSRPKRPRALILGPTKELTHQITGVAKTLCHHVKFRAAAVNANTRMKQQRDALAGPIDVVVGTPTRFLQHIDAANVYYRDIQWLVIDEADTMFAQGWGEEVQRILGPLRCKSVPANVLLVSATMTQGVKRMIAAELPALKHLETSSLHHAIVGSRHQFLSLPPGRDKLDQLSELLGADIQRGHKVLVFCNTLGSCRAVEYFCKENSISCVCYHGDMPIAERKDSMARFVAVNANAEGGQSIMIATDLAARGLDFPSAIDHVINFDFTNNPVDYLHRSGRTARAGASGKITSIITARDRVLAKRIEWALEHGEPLDQLSRDPRVIPPSQRRLQLAIKPAGPVLHGRKRTPRSQPGQRSGVLRFGAKNASRGGKTYDHTQSTGRRNRGGGNNGSKLEPNGTVSKAGKVTAMPSERRFGASSRDPSRATGAAATGRRSGGASSLTRKGSEHSTVASVAGKSGPSRRNGRLVTREQDTAGKRRGSRSSGRSRT